MWTQFSARDQLSSEQIETMIFSIRELLSAYGAKRRELLSAWGAKGDARFTSLQEYGTFIQDAYKLGFVCHDINGPAFEQRMVALTRDCGALRRAGLSTIRKYVHTLMRSERFGDAGGPDGGGTIRPAVESGALAAVADRLADELASRKGQASGGRTYAYVITNDGGTAPCYEDGFLTLAVCKPAIRRVARPGDLVIAYNGSGLGDPHGVRWAGVVKEKLGFADYWRDARFKGRADNIYRPVEGALPEPVTDAFEHVGGELHPEREHWSRDLDGRWVLVFRPWWYFGNRGPEAEAGSGLRMGPVRQGHRVFEGAVKTDWLAKTAQEAGPVAEPPVMPRAAPSKCGSAPRPRRRPKKGVCVPVRC